MSQTVDFVVNFKKGNCINIRNELADKDELQGIGGIENHSLLIERVQTKIGKVIEGYDNGDGFIDDTDAVNAATETKNLEMEAFRISLAQKANTAAQRSEQARSKSNDSNVDAIAGSSIEALEPYIEKLNKIMSPLQEDFLHKISSNKKSTPIKITDEMLQVVDDCVKEKVNIESATAKNPTKRKIEQWQKEAITYVFEKCFKVNEYSLTTFRKFSMQYHKFIKARDGAPDTGNAPEE
ncbi:hypothetical protein TVAG_006120 [Trichomonas vaginalis G3]|uniref:Uncharacterized protein n=1 Tax=Trichomonas vaginalis (strain ATCC PRA-98 / G3) TaxID=412133 RepID=A2E719_TRIV3|nr:hypothetical protein TVAGG3_0982640 [Trichomonas vaginalis G3]EAY11537.1 hypothetical protein TVAG_006120 [Trichomonas vaginalis G3]KAI5489421.1 hypothetical protein TVAGG3_0982640 [Trichomonas vaginalis G3]|eukprot:XP_001323760.1 hypothetical protein [Trichomonas vaginalis G3]